ncbi:MAG: hypothetical protein QM820_21840 [Minicystis sp.]
MRGLFFPSLFAFGAVVAACSATGNNTFPSGSNGTGGTGAGSGMGGDVNLGAGFATSTGVGGGSTGDDCIEAAKLVYVLSTDNHIWSFEPANKKFTDLFVLPCNTSMQPNSMAVDRNAVAWVNYVDSDPLFGGDTAGAIYKVDIQKKTCTATSINLPSGWYRLGMGFSTDAASATSETLYVTGTADAVNGTGSPGLGKIDVANNSLVPIGDFTGNLQGQSAELTGTGDAKLFGFFTTTPVHVAQIDKTTGATPASGDNALNQVDTPLAWAFSFWGGDFYLYTSDGFSNSNVTQFDPVTKAVNTSYMPNAGFIIVGAGVSTCAPLTPPK